MKYIAGSSTLFASQSEVAQIPLIGKVAAGEPILAVENIEGYFPMPVDRLPNAETFLLKVQGESMVNAGILDGDLVLVEQQATAENGEKIVNPITIPNPIKNNIKPISFSTFSLPFHWFGIVYASSPFPDAKRSTKSGTISRILVSPS